MRPGYTAREVDLDLRGVRALGLLVSGGSDGISYNHANWAEARFKDGGAAVHRNPSRCRRRIPPVDAAAGVHTSDLWSPVHGAGPGRPFLSHIPVQGECLMRFHLCGRPRGLTVGSDTES